MPGRCLPSRYSRLAPPPVEMWPNGVVGEPETAYGGCGIAATDDGEAVDLGERRSDRPGALGEGVELEDPHRAVPEHGPGTADRLGEALARLGSDVEPDLVAGHRVGRHHGRGRVRVERGRDHDVGGQHDLDTALGGPAEVLAAGLHLVLLEQALADLVALRRQEGEHHPAADQQGVGLAEQVVDHRELVADLGAAEHDHVGPLRGLGESPQDLDLGAHQPAHRVRQELRDVVHAGLLAVHDPEAVADERVAEVGELGGELRTLGVVLAGLARVEADVLQQGDLTVGQALDDGVRRLPDRVGGEAIRRSSSSPSRFATGAREYAGSGDPLGRPRWAITTTRAPASASSLIVGHAGPDPAVVGDRVPVEGDVQVRTDQDPLPADTAPEGSRELIDAAHAVGLRGSCRRG